MSETILDFCKVCGTPSAVHVPGGLFCLQKQLAAEKELRHDAMTAYAKLEADWRTEKGLREAAETRAAGQLQELQKVYAEADEERLRQTDAAHAEAAQWKAEDDWYGWNFHEGRAAGTVGASLYFGRVGRKIAALLAPAPEQGGGGDGN